MGFRKVVAHAYGSFADAALATADHLHSLLGSEIDDLNQRLGSAIDRGDISRAARFALGIIMIAAASVGVGVVAGWLLARASLGPRWQALERWWCMTLLSGRRGALLVMRLCAPVAPV